MTTRKRTSKAIAVAVPVPEAPEEILSQVPTALEHGVRTFLKSPAIGRVFDAARQFADIDHAAQGFSEGAGRFFASVLYQLDEGGRVVLNQEGKPLPRPIEEQKEIVWAMADYYKCERPSYETGGVGRPTAGRTELSEVVYHAHPDALKPAGGASKDTKGGKRITDHVRRFFLSQRAPRPERPQGEERQIPERTWKSVFARLWELSDDTEKLVLFRAFDRNKILDLDTMYKLTKGEIVGVAARRVESVTPTVS